MDLTPAEEETLRSLVHDINGQLFLIRGHCELAKRNRDEEQRAKNLEQIQSGTDELERLVREMRVQLGFPKVLEQEA